MCHPSHPILTSNRPRANTPHAAGSLARVFGAAMFAAALLPAAVVIFGRPVASAEELTSAQQAYNAGAKAINDDNLAAARGPLEAAVKLAPDDKFRLKAHEALMIPCRELPEIEPMQQSAEFVITHSEREAQRSLTRKALLAFIHKRGKLESATKQYEERLEKFPEDRTTLYLLVEIHATFLKNPARSADLAEKLGAVDKKLGKNQDVSGQAKQAQQLVRAKKLKEGAELYEKIAPLDKSLEAWHYKEAASAWLKAGDKAAALAAARKADQAAPETRTELLAYYFHIGLGDVFLATGAAKEAVPHYKLATQRTTQEPQLKPAREGLAKAEAAAGQ